MEKPLRLLSIIRPLQCLILALLPCSTAWAMPPQVQLGADRPEISMAAVMALNRVPVVAVNDPNALWALPFAAPRPELEEISLEIGTQVVGRVQVKLMPGPATYYVQVPSPRIDQVQLWFRADGGPWRGARAGDRVPMAQWPFLGLHPAFAIPVDGRSVDLIMVLQNNGPLSVAALMRTEEAFQNGRLRQTNLSGLVTGMGLMVTVMVLIAALMLREASWVVLAFAVWVNVTSASFNGSAPIWLLPDWPWLNDGSKLMSANVLSALLLWAVSRVLEQRSQPPVLRALGPAALLVAVVGSALLLTVAPAALRLPGTVAFSFACVAAALALCWISHRRGGRFVGLVGGAVLAYALVLVLGRDSGHITGGLDWRLVLTAWMLYGCALLLLQAQSARVRYGRDVLGRAAVSADRDPLTALWSYDGLLQRHAEAALREAAGQGASSLMLVALPGLDRSGADHGLVLVERALVRMAAALQTLLGQDWVIGRLSKRHFVAISLRPLSAEVLVQTATQVLSQCARIEQPLNPVSEFDMHIVCRHRKVGGTPFAELLREVEEAGRQLEDGKRITLL